MLHAIKEVPDLYYYIDGGYIGKEQKLVEFHYFYDNYEYHNRHHIVAESNLLDYYLMQSLQDMNDFIIYTKTYGRSYETGKDEILCYKYTDVNLDRCEYTTKCDGDQARFKYTFTAATREPISINDLPQAMKDEIK